MKIELEEACLKCAEIAAQVALVSEAVSLSGGVRGNVGIALRAGALEALQMIETELKSVYKRFEEGQGFPPVDAESVPAPKVLHVKQGKSRGRPSKVKDGFTMKSVPPVEKPTVPMFPPEDLEDRAREPMHDLGVEDGQ